jgi:hypothetical protein
MLGLESRFRDEQYFLKKVFCKVDGALLVELVRAPDQARVNYNIFPSCHLQVTYLPLARPLLASDIGTR